MLGPTDHVVVVGASLAGTNAVLALRHGGFAGPITVVDADPEPPYDRPPLSKQVLAGEWGPDRIRLALQPGGPEGVTWRLGERAAALDLAGRGVTLEGGDVVGFDALVIATGAVARWPGSLDRLAGTHVVRTLADSLALRADLDEAAGRSGRVVVVGAGFIGGEVAAVCRGRGLDVTMVEALPVPLARVLGERVGGAVAALHESHGVDLRLGVGVDAFAAGPDGRVAAVALADGTEVAADVVVVGVGASPATGWLAGSGLLIDDGVRCDATLAVLDDSGEPVPGVVAAGDLARWPNQRFDGELMRIEHWDLAVSMGAAAARRLLADDAAAEPFAPVPWFWSDQYDRKLQLAGWTRGDDDVAVIDGELAGRGGATPGDTRFAVLYGRRGRLVGVLGCGRPAKVARWRNEVEAAMPWDDALAAAGATILGPAS